MQGGPIYLKWWFWVAFVVLLAGTWYLRGYFEWRGEDAGSTQIHALEKEFSALDQRASDLESRFEELEEFLGRKF